jgi:glycosyltransferase involved in cell wall biosynthesis
MRILHIISPVRYGGGESLLVTLLKQNTTPELCESVVAMFHSPEFAKKLDEINIFYEYVKNNNLGDGSTRMEMYWLGFRALLAVPRLYVIIYRLQPDLIHVHSFPATIFIAVLKSLCLIRVPIVNTRHFIFLTHGRLQRTIFSWMFLRFDTVTCVSDCVRQSVLAQYPAIRDCQVIYNCVDAAFFAVIDRQSHVNGRRVFLQIARFSPVKNHLLVVEAIASMPHEIRQRISVWFAGAGETEARVRKRAAELGLTFDEIRFLGFVPHSEIPRLMVGVDFGLFPSDNEGFGIGAAECMAAGRPVLCLDNELMREVVGSGGVLVRKDELAKGFLEMLNVGDSLQIMSRKQAANYRPPVIKIKYINLYQRILARRENQ